MSHSAPAADSGREWVRIGLPTAPNILKQKRASSCTELGPGRRKAHAGACRRMQSAPWSCGIPVRLHWTQMLATHGRLTYHEHPSRKPSLTGPESQSLNLSQQDAFFLFPAAWLGRHLLR